MSCVVSTYLYSAFDCIVACHLNFRFLACSYKKFLDIQATIKCGFTLKRVRDMIRTYSQMHCTDKCSQHSSIIWLVWLNGWVFVFELSGCGFESICSRLNFRFCTCFVQIVPWHSGIYRVWIHSETHTWHDKNIQTVSSFSYIAPFLTGWVFVTERKEILIDWENNRTYSVGKSCAKSFCWRKTHYKPEIIWNKRNYWSAGHLFEWNHFYCDNKALRFPTKKVLCCYFQFVSHLYSYPAHFTCYCYIFSKE